MSANKISCDSSWCQEWKKDPMACCKKYGINPSEVDPRAMKDCSKMSNEELKSCLQKSRCCSMFDWSSMS